eukprot:scaffold54873_cov67-Phaeocystis_antarctica.AAC.2
MLQNWVFMYVSAFIGWWRPGGSTCLSAAAVAVRGRTGSAGAGATQPRRSRRGGAGEGGAGRARGDRRDFAKGLLEGTSRRDFSKGLCEGTFRKRKDFFFEANIMSGGLNVRRTNSKRAEGGMQRL